MCGLVENGYLSVVAGWEWHSLHLTCIVMSAKYVVDGCSASANGRICVMMLPKIYNSTQSRQVAYSFALTVFAVPYFHYALKKTTCTLRNFAIFLVQILLAMSFDIGGASVKQTWVGL